MRFSPLTDPAQGDELAAAYTTGGNLAWCIADRETGRPVGIAALKICLLYTSVTAAKSAEGTYTNARVQVYNDLIRTLAREKEVYLLDVWSAFAGGDGALPAGESSDGIHLFPRYYERWLTYLQTHTVSAP